MYYDPNEMKPAHNKTSYAARQSDPEVQLGNPNP
jgi:hypothetical protein